MCNIIFSFPLFIIRFSVHPPTPYLKKYHEGYFFVIDQTRPTLTSYMRTAILFVPTIL